MTGNGTVEFRRWRILPRTSVRGVQDNPGATGHGDQARGHRLRGTVSANCSAAVIAGHEEAGDLGNRLRGGREVAADVLRLLDPCLREVSHANDRPYSPRFVHYTSPHQVRGTVPPEDDRDGSTDRWGPATTTSTRTATQRSERLCVRRSRAATCRERQRGHAGLGGRCCDRRGSREPASLGRCVTVPSGSRTGYPATRHH